MLLSQHSHYCSCRLLFFFRTFSGIYLLLQILSYSNHSSIKMFSFLRTLLLVFFFFLPFILLEIFNFFCKIFPIHPYGDFFKFHSAITSTYVQLFKPFKYSNVQLFISSPQKLTLNQMGKASNPLQNSTTFNLILSLIHWARDTIQTLKQSQDLELLTMYSVFKNLVRFWKYHSFSFKDF